MEIWTSGVLAIIALTLAVSLVVIVRLFLQHMVKLNEYVFVEQKTSLEETSAKMETHKQQLTDMKRFNEIALQAQSELLQERSQDPQASEDNIGPQGNFRRLPGDWGVDGQRN